MKKTTKSKKHHSSENPLQDELNYYIKQQEDDNQDIMSLREENTKLKWANNEMMETLEGEGVNIIQPLNKLGECKFMLLPVRGILTLFQFYFSDKERVQGGEAFPVEDYMALGELSGKAVEMMDSTQDQIDEVYNAFDKRNKSLRECKKNVQE